MLTIRQSQMTVFSEQELRNFEDWMVVHLRKFFPSQCAVMGERGLREFIQYGMRRAAHHGFKARRDVCKYIDLMIVFGRDFEKDKKGKWAAEILARRGHPSAKMQLLFTTAKQHLKNR